MGLLIALDPSFCQNKQQTGEWGAPFHMSSRCVHATLLKGTSSHSKVVWWPEEDNTTTARVWDWSPGSTIPTPPPAFTIATNLFCAGHSVMPNGDIMVTGGTELGEVGIKETNIFSTKAHAWTVGDPMEFPRWYPTNTTLASGDILISAGQEQADAILFGGFTGSGHSGATTLIKMRNDLAWTTPSFDPGTGPTARSFHSTVDMGDGWREDGCGMDENRYGTIIYGGESADGVLQDLWGFRWNKYSDTYNWHQIPASGNPPGPLCRHSAIYDTLGQDMYIYGGLRGAAGISNTLYRLNGIHANQNCTPDASWETITPTGTAPPALFGHNAFYDGRRNRMILFGGRDGTRYYNQVWLLNLTGTPSWEGPLPLETSAAPTGRSGAQAVFDTSHHIAEGFGHVNNRLLVFGGFKDVNFTQVPVSDTLWSGEIIEGPGPRKIKWVAIPLVTGAGVCPAAETQTVLNNLPSEIPTPRGDGVMCLQGPPYSRILMYGGDTNGAAAGGESNELWELQLGPATCGRGYLHWLPRNAGTPPGTRTGFSFIYDSRPKTARKPELYSLSSGNLSTIDAAKWLYSYPFMHLLPNGDVFYSGVDTKTARLTVQGSQSYWTEVDESDFLGDTGVLVPTSNGSHVMKCGQKHNQELQQGKYVGSITLDQNGTGEWTNHTGQFLLEDRQDGNLTILPDGRVLLSGGTQVGFPMLGVQGRNKPLIWDPTTAGWNVHNGGDPSILADCPTLRDYHSIALLLPDATVLTAGGEDTTHTAVTRRLSGEIYSPPYLFSGDQPASRPLIQNSDEVIGYGTPFKVNVVGADPIPRLTLVRPGSVTHGFNQEQRFAEVSITSSVIDGGVRKLTATGPANGNVAPPGYYMLFALNANGVPSIARWVQIGTPRSGTLLQNETWGEYAVVMMTDDIIVPAGKTLTIKAGTRVGTSSVPAVCPRLVVLGHLNVIGDVANPAVLGSATASRSEDAWEGIVVESGGRITMTHGVVQNALNGVHIVEQRGVSTSNSITNSTFTRNKQYDIIADGVYDFSGTVGLTISNCIDSVGAGTGVWLTAHMKDAAISNNLFCGSGGVGGSVSGLHFDHPGGTSAPLITGNTFSGFSTGQGLKLGGGRAKVRSNVFSGSKYGATILGGAHEFVPTMGGTVNNSFLNLGASGVQIVGTGTSPIFRQNLFSGNYNGVVSKSGATPNFGTSPDPGMNSVIGSINKCFWNQSANGVDAIGNYWGYCFGEGELPACVVNATSFPTLCTSPFSARRPMLTTEPAASHDPGLQCRSGSVVHGSVEFEILHGSTPWEELRVYDVLGRLRDVVRLDATTEGLEHKRWAPANYRDGGLSAGIYFATAWRRGAESKVLRLVVVSGGGVR
jgi:hypothetical protein